MFPWKGTGMHTCTFSDLEETRPSEKAVGLWRSKTFPQGAGGGLCVEAGILVNFWWVCRGNQRHVTRRMVTAFTLENMAGEPENCLDTSARLSYGQGVKLVLEGSGDGAEAK